MPDRFVRPARTRLDVTDLAASQALGLIPSIERSRREVRPLRTEKGAVIASAGGYLRELTRKAEAGEFTLGPMPMAPIGSRKREKKRA